MRRREAKQALQLAQHRYLTKSGLLVEWEETYRAWLASEINYWDLDYAHKNALIQLHIHFLNYSVFYFFTIQLKLNFYN
ncbi:MAG TPA: hypothetical protein VJN02_09040 [Gammaproteobacteria bacterium]|nr:hypothetical protein [Gammaproteobacteria bacterium]